MKVSGYRLMWVVVMFDLPTDTKKARRDYTVFRSKMKKDGFHMMQYSVYARSCPSEENAAVHVKRIRSILPPEGEVRILRLTDKQFSRMQVFYGRKRAKTETAPEQLEFF